MSFISLSMECNFSFVILNIEKQSQPSEGHEDWSLDGVPPEHQVYKKQVGPIHDCGCLSLK